MSEWKSDKCDRHQRIESAGGCSYCEVARLNSELAVAHAEVTKLKGKLLDIVNECNGLQESLTREGNERDALRGYLSAVAEAANIDGYAAPETYAERIRDLQRHASASMSESVRYSQSLFHDMEAQLDRSFEILVYHRKVICACTETSTCKVCELLDGR